MTLNAFSVAVLLLVLTLSATPTHSTIIQTQYLKPSHCPGMALASNLRFQSLSTRSLLQCLGRCREALTCLSVAYESSSRSCQLGSARATTSCSNMEPVAANSGGVTHHEQIIDCQHGGRVLVTDNTCLCDEPYHGSRCENIYRDCWDIQQNGVTGRRTFTIFPTSSPAPFQIMCNAGFGWAYAYFRTLGDVDFNQNWQSYVDGFGLMHKDHWLGLERLYLYAANANRNYKLRMSFGRQNGTVMYVIYGEFRLGGAGSGYNLSVVQNFWNRPAANCMGPLSGAQFSTYDRDNDNGIDNCAQQHGGGWWFSGDSCTSLCSPLGLFGSANNNLWSGNPTDAFWDVAGERLALYSVKMYLERAV